MATIIQSKMTDEEYLAFLETSEMRYELSNGELRKMVGTTDDHTLIVIRLIIWLGNQLEGTDCQVRSGDTLIKVRKSGSYRFCDVSVTTEAARFGDDAKRLLLNPALIIEVLSRSTEKADRGEKFDDYKQLSSFTEYLLITQDKPLVEQHQRQPDGRWELTTYNQMSDVVRLSSVGLELPLTAIYQSKTRSK